MNAKIQKICEIQDRAGQKSAKSETEQVKNLRNLRNLRDLKKYLLLIHRMSFSSSYTFRAYRIQSNRAQEGWWR